MRKSPSRFALQIGPSIEKLTVAVFETALLLSVTVKVRLSALVVFCVRLLFGVSTNEPVLLSKLLIWAYWG